LLLHPVGPYSNDAGSPNKVQVEAVLQQGWSQGFSRIDLLQVLVALQHHFGWISPSAMAVTMAQVRDEAISISEIKGLVAFYHFLQLQPPAAWQIHLSTNITDLMQGQQQHWSQLQQYAQSNPQQLQLYRTSCTGLCDQGPALLLNGIAIANLNPTKIQSILQLIDEGKTIAHWPEEIFAIEDPIIAAGPLLNHVVQPGQLLAKIKQKGKHFFLQSLQESGLQGRGGAAFNTFIKWQSCIDAESENKYVICNADEGEPGTFKDRVLLCKKIENILEGMSICAHVIGAQQGFIYLRKEYLFLLQHIQAAIAARRQQGLLGENFDIDIHLGAGAYVCGEESALIESMEGKRGIPRIRPPFPVSHGYRQQPTVVNNVETFCNVALIADQGVDVFREQGTKTSPGTKLHSVAGDCDKRGIVELPLGASINALLQLVDASDCQAVQLGGPSGLLLGPDKFHMALDFEHVNSGGSCMIFNKSRDITSILANYMHFFAVESCGFCTPCRVGTKMISDKMQKMRAGNAGSNDLALIQRSGEALVNASHCGLGKAAGQCVQQVLQDFDEHFQKQITGEFAPEPNAESSETVSLI
jgi:[NiFe] hydrogenase diaphorase moiety large subunit